MKPLKTFVLKSLKIAGLLLLGITLVYVIWQPVLPSGLIIQGMTRAIDPQKLALERPMLVRFELSGKGGGIYNLVVDKDSVEVVKGDMVDSEIDWADLILYMDAKDFNNLMIAMATGKADESAIIKQVIGKFLRVAGDIMTFKTLLQPDTASE